jgi:ketosteroid isomerase-like protein
MTQTFGEFLEQRIGAGLDYLRGDGAAVAALSAQTGQSTFFTPKGGLIEGAEAIVREKLEGARRFGPASNSRWICKDQGESGDLAFWVGYQEIEADVNGEPQASSIRITELYRRTEGAWKIVHRHASLASQPRLEDG